MNENDSNIITLMDDTQQAAQRLDPSDIFFPVKSLPLQAVSDTGNIVNGDEYQVIVRDDDTVIGVHKNKFKIYQTEDIVGPIDDAIRHHTALDTEGMIVEDRIAYGGAQWFRTYRFPNETAVINSELGVGDIIEYKIDIAGSFDGSQAFGAMAGAYRLICKNGMTVGDVMARIKMKQTAHLDPLRIAAQLVNASNAAKREAAKWNEYTRIAVTDDQALAVFEKIPNVSKAKAEVLHQKYWFKEAITMGRNKWSLFNALTAWSTHEDVRDASKQNVRSIQVERDTKVAKTINSPEFLQLAA